MDGDTSEFTCSIATTSFEDLYLRFTNSLGLIPVFAKNQLEKCEVSEKPITTATCEILAPLASFALASLSRKSFSQSCGVWLFSSWKCRSSHRIFLPIL